MPLLTFAIPASRFSFALRSNVAQILPATSSILMISSSRSIIGSDNSINGTRRNVRWLFTSSGAVGRPPLSPLQNSLSLISLNSPLGQDGFGMAGRMLWQGKAVAFLSALMWEHPLSLSLSLSSFVLLRCSTCPCICSSHKLRCSSIRGQVALNSLIKVSFFMILIFSLKISLHR